MKPTQGMELYLDIFFYFLTQKIAEIIKLLKHLFAKPFYTVNKQNNDDNTMNVLEER